MRSCATCLLVVAVSMSSVACAERQSPFEPLSIRPSSVVLLPGITDQALPMGADPYDPSMTVNLPTYAEQVIVAFKFSGLVNVGAARPSKGSTVINGSGYWRGDAIQACYVNVIFRYQLGLSWGPGACHTSPPVSLRTDTVLVQGTGTVKRGPAIAQQSYECPGVPRCWIYGTSAGGDEQKFSVTPLWSAINLTTPGTPEVAPGTIEIPPYPMNTVFKITSNPLTFKGINVPIRVLTWQWLNAAGVPSYIQFAGGPLLVQRSAYITERGSMVVTAFVNGVEQVDTVKVIGPEIRLTLQKESMLPSQIYTGRNKPDTQMVQVSVVDRNDQVMPNRLVNMTLSAVEGAAGHAHINSSKPKPAGLISPQVNTGPNGNDLCQVHGPRCQWTSKNHGL